MTLKLNMFDIIVYFVLNFMFLYFLISDYDELSKYNVITILLGSIFSPVFYIIVTRGLDKFLEGSFNK